MTSPSCWTTFIVRTSKTLWRLLAASSPALCISCSALITTTLITLTTLPLLSQGAKEATITQFQYSPTTMITSSNGVTIESIDPSTLKTWTPSTNTAPVVFNPPETAVQSITTPPLPPPQPPPEYRKVTCPYCSNEFVTGAMVKHVARRGKREVHSRFVTCTNCRNAFPLEVVSVPCGPDGK